MVYARLEEDISGIGSGKGTNGMETNKGGTDVVKLEEMERLRQKMSGK